MKTQSSKAQKGLYLCPLRRFVSHQTRTFAFIWHNYQRGQVLHLAYCSPFGGVWGIYSVPPSSRVLDARVVGTSSRI
jgi:hypothetical protein